MSETAVISRQALSGPAQVNWGDRRKRRWNESPHLLAADACHLVAAGNASFHVRLCWVR